MGLIDTVAIRKGYPIMMTDREEHIKNLSYIMDSMPDDACGNWRDSLAYAISSLKTDEAYQLMYEGEEIYTKADMVAMLTEIQLEIEELDTPNNGSAYMDCSEIIQQKIDSLEGNK